MTAPLDSGQLDELQRLYNDALSKLRTAYIAPLEWLNYVSALIKNGAALISAARDGAEYARMKAVWIDATKVVDFDPLEVLALARIGLAAIAESAPGDASSGEDEDGK